MPAAQPDNQQLESVLRSHQIDVPSDQIELMHRYCHALWEWNRKLNLTRHTDYEKFVTRDVIDCLAIEP